MSGARLDLPLTVAIGDRDAVVNLAQPGSLTLSAFEASGVAAGPLSAEIVGIADVPLVRRDAAGMISGAWLLRVAAAPLRIARGTAPIDLVLDPGALTSKLQIDPGGAWSADVALSGGALVYPAAALRATGIGARLALAEEGLAKPLAVEVETIRHEGQPPLFAPLRLRGTADQTTGTNLTFEWRIESRLGGVLTLTGDADLAAATGRAIIDLEPLRFAPGSLQPKDLAPVLGKRLKNVTGEVELLGEIALADGGLMPDLSLLLDDLAFTAGPAAVAGLSGVIVVDRLFPLEARTDPALSIRAVDIGLPLTRGKLAFELGAGGDLEVRQLRFDLGGGQVVARPFRFGVDAQSIETELTMERLDLARLLAALEFEGLTGRGMLSGTLPVAVRGDSAKINEGVLASVGGGQLSYTGGAGTLGAGGESAGLLLQALENFHYDALQIRLNGQTDDEMDVELHLEGANPDLYDGHPIEFNLHLEGALGALVQRGVAAWTLPERLRDRIEQGSGR